jgi:hypothetical protein
VRYKTNEGTAENVIRKFADHAVSVHFNEILVHHQEPDGMNELALAMRHDSSRCSCSELISVPVLEGNTELRNASLFALIIWSRNATHFGNVRNMVGRE